MKKILLVRLDCIGDLVLTLPVDQNLGSYDVLWAVPQGLGFIPELAVPKRKYQSFSKQLSGLIKFFRFVRMEKPDISVVFHAPWWVGFVLWLCRVPVRIGVLSQWHSFLFWNQGFRQKRSLSQKHEFHYNLELLQKGLSLTHVKTESYLKIAAPGTGDTLRKFNLKEKKYYVVHPGMGGSALNWPLENYKDLILELTKTNPVVITGTSMDLEWLEPLKAKLNNHSDIFWLDQKLNVTELLEILKSALAVVAPSTGVIHLAASLEVPTVGLYSPVPIESPVRWGPRGPLVKALVPEVSGQRMDSEVMKFLKVSDVLNSIKEFENGSFKGTLQNI